MPRARTGSVEPGRRADGSTYYRARIRLGDKSRERVDVPAKYTSREAAELYAEARQEREDQTGELLAKKIARAAAAASKQPPSPSTASSRETATEWYARY
ncbi:MAG TPA: hypothetical protein VF316_13780, partial [Polyangiaceae bacterium]